MSNNHWETQPRKDNGEFTFRYEFWKENFIQNMPGQCLKNWNMTKNYMIKELFMDKVTIIPLKSVNGVPFGATKEEVRKVLGSDYKNSIEEMNKPMNANEQKALDEVENAIKALYQHMGKDPNSFEWPDISEFEEDTDTYNLVQIEYEDDIFVAAAIYAQDLKHLTIWNHDCSDLEIEKILTLAEDFEWDQEDTSWTSRSKQISIYCSEGPRKIDSITFGCPGYFDFLDEE